MKEEFTLQQKQMIDIAGRMWRKDWQPDMFTLCIRWSMEISQHIPVYSIVRVYDWLVETGYYNPQCL